MLPLPGSGSGGPAGPTAVPAGLRAPPGPGLQLGTCGPAGFTPSTGSGVGGIRDGGGGVTRALLSLPLPVWVQQSFLTPAC